MHQSHNHCSNSKNVKMERSGEQEIRDLSIDKAEYPESLVNAAVEYELPFALYRLPGDEDKIYFQMSLQSLELLERVQLEELDKGFLFSKFDGEKYYLKADLCWNSREQRVILSQSSANKDKLDEILEFIQKHRSFNGGLHKLPSGRQEKADETFLDLVRDGVKQIENGLFEKIVPSRAHLLPEVNDSTCIESFNRLCNSYPNAFVSLFSAEETGSWLGATPELLVQTEDNKDFRTVALAGTQPFEGQDLRTVAWTQKEIEEQAMVSRYIINCFKKIRLREFEEHGPRTVIAGNLVHLKTSFSVDMEATNFPQLGSVMLELLHPTSAVCGMPLEQSLNFLKENEELDRRFYSGFLGPVNVADNTSIFVNLRCLEYTEDGAKLYAGAGVTIDSIPESELEETELKFDTLRKIILK